MADPSPSASTPTAGSTVGGLVIPLVLIAVAGVVFGVFYFLNASRPQAVPSATTPIDTTPTHP